MKWLEDAVEEHIKNNPNKDSVDICTHFKLRVDITMKAISNLQEQRKVKRVHLFGCSYRYIKL